MPTASPHTTLSPFLHLVPGAAAPPPTISLSNSNAACLRAAYLHACDALRCLTLKHLAYIFMLGAVVTTAATGTICPPPSLKRRVILTRCQFLFLGPVPPRYYSAMGSPAAASPLSFRWFALVAAHLRLPLHPCLGMRGRLRYRLAPRLAAQRIPAFSRFLRHTLRFAPPPGAARAAIRAAPHWDGMGGFCSDAAVTLGVFRSDGRAIFVHGASCVCRSCSLSSSCSSHLLDLLVWLA